MRRLRALKLFAFVALGLGAVLVADLGQAVAENFLVPQEDAMHARVNEVRSTRGLARVDDDDALRWMSRRQSQAMAAEGYIFHNPDLAADADGASLTWYALGENVGRGPDWQLIQESFEQSPTHLTNIVHSGFNALGVGGLAHPDDSLFFTQTYAGLESQPAAPTAQQSTVAPPTQPPPTPDPTPQTTPTPTPTPTPADAAQPPGDTEVQSGQVEPTPGPLATGDQPGQGTQPQRPSLWDLLLAMFLRLADKLAFWA